MLATLDIHLMPRALYLLMVAVAAQACIIGMAWPLFSAKSAPPQTQGEKHASE